MMLRSKDVRKGDVLLNICMSSAKLNPIHQNSNKNAYHKAKKIYVCFRFQAEKN